jgi:hypothetical protein
MEVVMARFYLMAAMSIGHQRHKAGTIIADTPGVSGDAIWTGLTAATVNSQMKPLDASAQAMKAASLHPNAPIACTITGAASIDA